MIFTLKFAFDPDFVLESPEENLDHRLQFIDLIALK